MAKLRHFIRICTSPMARARALRSDDRGQVMLLSGMMVFVVLIMTIFTFDTGKAIYNRIIAQNAVDSAADAAALWQARGCNLLQHLNNLHYNVNVAIYILESAALISCVAAPLLNLIPFVGAALSQAACVICKTAPTLDQADGGHEGPENYLEGISCVGLPLWQRMRDGQRRGQTDWHCFRLCPEYPVQGGLILSGPGPDHGSTW